jgi:hypothetical protein
MGGEIIMLKNLSTDIVLAAAMFILVIGVSNAETNFDKEISMARSAAPAAISAASTIVVDGKVVVEGTNGWDCMPDNGAPSCNDATWMEAMGAMATKSNFQADRIGISYMLLGEPTGGGVSNSDPFHPEPRSAEDYVETGPHLMIIVPKKLLEGITFW